MPFPTRQLLGVRQTSLTRTPKVPLAKFLFSERWPLGRSRNGTSTLFAGGHASHNRHPCLHELVLGTRTRSGQRHRVRDRAEASIRCQRTLPAGSEGARRGRPRIQAAMPGCAPAGFLRSRQSARRSRTAAGPSRGFAPLRGERGTLCIREGRCRLSPRGRSHPCSGSRIGAAAGASLRHHPSSSDGRPTQSWAGSVRGCSCRPPFGPEPGAPVAKMAKTLGPQELGPRRSDPPRRRPQTAPAQHVRDRRGGDRDAELEQLAFDPQVAPSGVLPGHPKDQVAYPGIDGGTSWPPTPPGPLAAHELPAPPGERVGTDQKGGPPLAGEEPAGRGQEGPVGRAVAGSVPPPADDPQLMAQHGDLQVPIIDAHADEQAENPHRTRYRRNASTGAV